uniref:Uncharacterized protein n=1 Tax=Plectus sambesii TaxID=2011161 RepID=A0A914UK67_9BILA
MATKQVLRNGPCCSVSKSASGGDVAQSSQTARVDPRALQLLQSLEKQSAMTFVPTNSQFGNLVLPVFPRFTTPPAIDDAGDNKS